MSERFDRQIALFGRKGQEKIFGTRVAVVGVGGVGSHVVQQLALLGIRSFALIEPEELDETNRNRFVGARHDDPIPGTPKLVIAARVIAGIEPEASIDQVPRSLVTEEAFEVIKDADVVFGCLDGDGARLILTELCAAHSRRYIDIASDVIPGDPPEWGCRVVTSWDTGGCCVCLEEIDLNEARLQIAGPAESEQQRAIYGIPVSALAGGGPSVVSVNGIAASIAVTEFMAGVTGIRVPIPLIRFRGWAAGISKRIAPLPDCYYCAAVRGKGDGADVERYIRDGVGDYL